MAAGLKIRGGDTAIVLAGPGGLVTSFSKIKDSEATFDGEILSEDYLDHDSPEFDEISNGIKGKFSGHHNDPDFWTLADRLEQRKRRISGFNDKYGISFSYRYPSTGTRVRLVILDIQFGAIPVKSGGRKQYVETSIDFASSAYKIIRS